MHFKDRLYAYAYVSTNYFLFSVSKLMVLLLKKSVSLRLLFPVSTYYACSTPQTGFIAMRCAVGNLLWKPFVSRARFLILCSFVISLGTRDDVLHPYPTQLHISKFHISKFKLNKNTTSITLPHAAPD